jgi:aryl-alcohol dehydrogenase-like predicted oxidoreductase
VRAGKVLYVGVSDTPAWVVARANTLAELRGWSPFVALQVEYSLVQREVERELLPMAAGLRLGVTAWSPLGGGVLTGKFDAGREGVDTGGRLGDIDERRQRISREVSAVARDIGVRPSQVALAWLRNRGVLPILGARTAAQLTENLGALDVRLDDGQLRRLDAVSAVPLGWPHDFLAGLPDVIHGPGTLERLDVTPSPTRV